MSFVVVGTNHKYSPVELRERISFSKRKTKEALCLLKKEKTVKGAVILSTCNRVEIYTHTMFSWISQQIIDFLCWYHKVERRRLKDYLYIYKEEEALRHLFRVATGLDSQILGETQISGQVRSSFEEAYSNGFSDEMLNAIFNSCIIFAKRIHRTTRISEGKISIGSVTIDFIKEKIGNLADKKILIIGVGKVCELILKYLSKEKPNVIFISNRTYSRAKELAIQIGAEAVRFDDLRKFLSIADIIISMTRSPHFIIKKETLENIKNPLFIVDLAIPRDIDPRVSELGDITLYTLEDLDDIIRKNIKDRYREAEKIDKMINIEVERLWATFTELEPEKACLR